MSSFKICAVTLSLLLGACSGPIRLYKMDIQQGNAISPKMLGDLQIGMDKDDAAQILGTACLQHPLEPDRWDYYYSLKTQNGKIFGEKRTTLYFKRDKLEKLSFDLHFAAQTPQSVILRMMGEPTARSHHDKQWDYVFHLPTGLGQRKPYYYSFYFHNHNLSHYTTSTTH